MSAVRAFVRQLAPPSVLRGRLIAALGRQIATSGEAELAQLGALVAPGDLCLDVGASAGLYAHELARLGARVIAFEPNPVAAARVELLSGEQVEVRRIALSDADGSATLTMPGDIDGLGTLRTDAFEGPVETVEVATRRLDGLGLSGVAFVKIDVEGFEEQVLDGGMATIARDLPVLLIEIEDRHNEGAIGRIDARLGGLGYDAHFLKGGAWLPIAAFDAALHQREADIAPMDHGADRRSLPYYNNFLFLPAGRAVPGVR